MKKLVFLLFIFAALGACKKNSSTKKFDRLVVNNNWKLAKWIDQGVNKSETFEDYIYEFTDHKEFISVNSGKKNIGSWDTQDAKNPAILILNIGETTPEASIADDWKIVFLSKDEMRLERLNQNYEPGDECIFKKL